MNINEKKRVIIFGTGWAFRNYIHNHRDEHEIIGITDWDYKNHGDEIQGIKVVNPFELSNYVYDHILIVSYFVREIKAQLYDRCKIGEEKTLLPFKYQMKSGKPFEDLKTLDFARKMVFFFSKLAKENNIILYLEYGTLLGIVRDGDIIKWDDDVDFAVNHEQKESFIDLLKSQIESFPFSDVVEWSIETKNTGEGDIRYVSILFRNKETPIFNEFEFGIRTRRTFDNISVVMKDKYLSCDARHFLDYDTINIDNQVLYLPHDHKGYLDFVYGNWREPKVIDFGFREGNLDTSHLNEYKVPLYKHTLS